jgi:hypothetical protein
MATRKRTTTKRADRNGTKVRVRMYRQGLGDCFLITFFTGQQPVHMLIDCGSIGEQTTNVTMGEVAQNIVETTGGRLDVLVATHEHQDHVNGFRNQPLFDPPFQVDRVWLAWTEDGSDDVAQDIEKYRGDLLNSVALTANALAPDRHPIQKGVREVLGFVGDPPPAGTPFSAKQLSKTVDEAMTWVTERANNRDKFLKPGKVIEPAWLPGIRFHILGPPRDKGKLTTLGRHGDEDLYELALQGGADLASCAAFAMVEQPFPEYRATLEGDERAAFERRLPFDPRFRVEISEEPGFRSTFEAYFDDENKWRRIDTDWLNVTADLALQLDNATNNTSLVLAMELIEDGRVLLFPGDAQLGNWLSWNDHTFKVKEADGSTRDVSASELLAQTVFYKVGHHSSHNATLRAKGLEQMRRDDLVAMIPLDSATASNKWPTASWPAEQVYAALCERTIGRVLRSDTDWPAASDRPRSISKADWDAARQTALDSGVIDVQNLYIDFNLR